MDWPGWIGAVATVFSVGFAIAAGWNAKRSKKARIDAVQAEERALEHLTAAKQSAEATQSTAAELRRLADRLEGPPLVAEQLAEYRWTLRNIRNSEIEIKSIDNFDDFQNLSGLDVPFTLPPYGSRSFLPFGYHPVELVLVLADDSELRVALPSGF